MHLSGGNDPYGVSDTAVPLGTWHHVAVVYELSGDMTFYIDGQPDGTASNMPTPHPNESSDLFIGRDSQAAGYYFDGAVDDVRIYDLALSTAEIDALYLLGSSPGTQYCPGDGVSPHTFCPCANNNVGNMGGCDWGDPSFPDGGVLDAVGTDSMVAIV